MVPDAIQQRLDCATEVARQAGQIALRRFSDRDSLKVDHKGLHDRVSDVDRAVETLIREAISKAFPSDSVLGEEFGISEPASDSDGGTWVIDPIDGTDCFVFGIPAWCVAIAWVHGDETRIGVVYDAVHDEMFTAVRGRGAFVDGVQITASNAHDSRAGLIGIGHSVRVEPELTLSALNRLIGMGGMFHRCGSGALSLAWVAAGRLIGYYEPHMNAWDCLAGLLLVTEAGGWTNDFLVGDGLRSGNAALAAAPGMVDQIKIIGGVAPERPPAMSAASEPGVAMD